MRIFRNREQAGDLLAERLAKLGSSIDLIAAIPKGGIVIGARIAERFGCELFPVITAKIRHPLQKEFVIGAVDAAGSVSIQAIHRQSIPAELLEESITAARQTLHEKQHVYAKIISEISVHGKSVVVVDDGITSGESAKAALRYLRVLGPARLVLAVPGASASGAKKARLLADQFVTLTTPSERFKSVSNFYEINERFTDGDVNRLLTALGRARPADFGEKAAV